MTETQLQRQILDGLAKRNVVAWLTHDAKHRPCAVGVPDIMAVLSGGRLFAIECKVGNAQPTMEQEMFIARLRAAGATAIISRTWDDAKRFLP